MAPTDEDGMVADDGQPDGRIRQYPLEHTGPFFVYIREINPSFPLKSVMFSKYLYAKFKSVTSVQAISRVKIRAELSNAADANELVKDPFFKSFRIYIPAEDVEVQGVIQLSSDCSAAECTEHGIGKFKYPDTPEIPILESFRITKQSDPLSAETGRVPTSFVRVTFAGKVLPDYVVLHGLLLPIKISIRKAMFCDNCLQLNHTAKLCSNKPVCPKCNESHTAAACTIQNPESLCKLCSGNHLSGDINNIALNGSGPT